MSTPVNISEELRVIKDSNYTTGFRWDAGYFGDAVRASVHSALIKIDAVLGQVLYGGGEVPLPDDTLIDLYAYGISGLGEMYTSAMNPNQVKGLATFEEVTPE